MQAFMDDPALARSDGFSQPGSGSLFPQPFFYHVKQSDLPQQPADDARRLFLGFIKFPARMRIASSELNLPRA